jgi:hypothetical protein
MPLAPPMSCVGQLRLKGNTHLVALICFLKHFVKDASKIKEK